MVIWVVGKRSLIDCPHSGLTQTFDLLKLDFLHRIWIWRNGGTPVLKGAGIAPSQNATHCLLLLLVLERLDWCSSSLIFREEGWKECTEVWGGWGLVLDSTHFLFLFFLRLVLPTCLACDTVSSKCTAFGSCSLSFSFYNLLLVSHHPKKAEGLKLSCLFHLQFSPHWSRVGEGLQRRHGCVSEAWSTLL